MFVFLHFYCIFSLFEFDIIPLDSGERLQSPIRVEYKLYQSAAATAASDKSLSDTLMPSNCLWRPLPVCCSPRTPSPTSSQPTLPLHSSSAPRPRYCWLDAIVQPGCPRVDPTPLKWIVFIVPQVCARPPKMCFSNGSHLLHLLFLLLLLLCFVFLSLYYSVFCQVFRDVITFCTWREICQVVIFTIWMDRCIRLLECKIIGLCISSHHT